MNTRDRLPADHEGDNTAEPHDIEPRYFVVVASGTSIGGLLVHNLAEFPLSILLRPETLVPVAVTVLLGMSVLRRPKRSVFVAIIGWTVIIIVFGGGSVLPLSILPFVPKQTIGHYVTHVVYALTQVPLLWVAWRGFRSYRRSD